MNSRERVRCAINFEQPDRVPLNISFTVDIYNRVREYLGYPPETNPKVDLAWTTVSPDLKLLEELGVDCVDVSVASLRSWIDEEGYLVDEFGLKRRRVENLSGGFYYEIVTSPLQNATVEDLENYPWPDPSDPTRYEGLEEKARYLYENTNFALIGKFTQGIFEYPAYLRGHQQWFLDFALNREFVEALMDKFLEIRMEYYRRGLELIGKYIDIVRLSGEDLGTQESLLISPRAFREIVKPRMKKLYGFVKETFHKYNPQGKLLLHSCGAIYPIIEDLIEAGVDILDPIQPRAKNMEPERLKREFGDRLCFHGGIDIQYLLPYGTPEEVEAEVIRRCRILGRGGGYIAGPAHNVQGDVPVANLMAMVEAVKKALE